MLEDDLQGAPTQEGPAHETCVPVAGVIDVHSKHLDAKSSFSGKPEPRAMQRISVADLVEVLLGGLVIVSRAAFAPLRG